MLEFSREILEPVVKASFTFSDVLLALGKCVNSRYLASIRSRIIELGISTAHFNKWHKQTKYPPVEKTCACGKKFVAKLGAPKEKQTCSHGCANTKFRSGKNNGNSVIDEESYIAHRKVCFKYHEKKCIICGEANILSVHHYDKDHFNNAPDNLIPLCPTHHQYCHSKFKYLVAQRIDEYRSTFLSGRIP